MKYITFDKKNILVILLLLLPERMLFLVNRNLFLSIFHIKYSDFVVAVYFALFIYVIQRYRARDLEKYYFKNILLFIIPLVIMASLVPNYLFGQSFTAGLVGQKDFVMIICSYYIFRTLILEKIVTTDYLWNCIYKLSFVITGVVIVQQALANYILILDVGYGKRFGVRITDNFTYATILLIGSLMMFFNTSSRKDKIVSVIGLAMSYYHVVFVSQTRIVMVAYGALTIVMALFFRNNVLKKITYLFILLGIMLIVSQTELAQYLLSSISDTSTDPSAQIREVGKALYLSEIIKTPLVGRGYPHSASPEAYQAAGLSEGIALNDNGLFGFAYIYGIIGLIWYVWLSVKMLICSFKTAKKGDYRFLLYTVFLQVICANIIWWYWRFSFAIVFTILLAIMEEYANVDSEHKVRFYFGN